MGSIRTRRGKHGVTYNALLRDEDGRQRSASFSTRTEARNFLKPQSPVASRIPTYVRPDAGTVAAYAANWVATHPLKPVARQTYQYALSRHIVPAIGKKKLTSVSRADIYAAMKRWQVDGMSPALQAKNRAVMTSMFEDAVQRGLIQENPARGVKISKQVIREMRIVTVEEYKRVLPLVPEEYRLLVRLLLASGARWGEAAELRPADLQGDTLVLSRNVAQLKSPHRFVIQGTLKNGKGRKVKIPAAIADELREIVRSRELNSDELFFGRGGTHMSREHFGQIWRQAQREAGITPPCRVHDLRHTAISWWLADGMPLSTVRDRAGHWNISVTSRYIHAIDDAEDDALGRSVA
jgi:integrase